MKLAIHNPSFTYPGGPENIAPVLAATARAAEEGGADQFTLMDHWFQIHSIGAPDEPMLEGYTALGFVAAQTRRMRLGLLVTGVTYRHPGLLAKTVTTLDVVSGGRAQLGLGAAWFEEEHKALGVPYPPLAERFERLEETIQICFQMWSEDDGPYKGKHYELGETMCVPAPVQQPRPTLMIGGSGERKTLRLVARYADACNLYGGERDVVAHKLEVLKGHCEAEGRDYDEIEKTIIYSIVNPAREPDRFLADMEEMAKLGIDKVWVSNKQVGDPAAWADEVCAQTVSRLAELG
ncbi:MAG TPA: LLM class F420-dependent oxidoreductase [Solirubrobacterales bacterium]|nr:LLM class F420-dependent oxidoreductase [Solirubrobacterales bacterium]